MTEESNSKNVRYRVGVSMTSTGKRSYDCTVELTGMPMEAVLAESDRLVAELDRRYAVVVPEDK